MQKPTTEQRTQAPDAAHAELRSATRADHEAVDAAFARYDLQAYGGYRGFLSAHARVLPALETALAPARLIPDWVGRTGALLSDLEKMQGDVPPAVTVDLPSARGARWGALYVLEGSRLGGIFLAKRIGEGFPAAFLSAAHAPGVWQRILRTIDQAAEGPLWIEDAVAGAKAVFAAYALAAAEGPL